MNSKFLIFKNPTNTRDGTNITILLDDKNHLFSSQKSTAIKDFFTIFDTTLTIGNIAFQNKNSIFYYANANFHDLPTGWSFKKFNSLTEKNCPDYQTIAKTLKKLSYKI